MLQLIKGDCLEEMKQLPDCSVDIVIADLPYGRFKHLEWDKAIDLEGMWKQIWRISKPNTPIFLFGDMKFGIQLINSQPKHFKYEIVWNKMKSTTPLLSRKRLGKATEYIFIFYKKQPIYNYAKYHKIKKVITDNAKNNNKIVGGKYSKEVDIHNNYEPQLPTNIINEVLPKKVTEKPQGILEFILKYFSNEGDVCLDMCMGSGSCGVACHTLGRKFIGIELNDEHFQIAKERLENIN